MINNDYRFLVLSLCLFVCLEWFSRRTDSNKSFVLHIFTQPYCSWLAHAVLENHWNLHLYFTEIVEFIIVVEQIISRNCNTLFDTDVSQF